MHYWLRKPRSIRIRHLVFFALFLSIGSSHARCGESASGQTSFLATFAGNVNGLAFTKDSRVLITAGQNSKGHVLGPGELNFWDAASGRHIGHVKQHLLFISAMAVSADGKLIATGAANGEIKLLDAHEKRNLAALHGHKGQINSLSFSADGKLLASASDLEPPAAMGQWHQSIVKVWEVGEGKEIGSFHMPRKSRSNAFLNVALSPDGKLLAVAPGDNTVKILDARSGKELKSIAEEKYELIPVLFARDGKTLFSGFGGRDKRVTAWNPAAGTEQYSLTSRGIGILNCLSLSANGKLLATGGHDGTATIWDLDTRKEKLAVVVEKEFEVLKLIYVVALSPDGKTLATSPSASLYGRPSVRLWDTETGREITPR